MPYSVQLLLLMGACAGRVPVAIDVAAVEPAPAPGEVVPRFVEVRHADRGWIHVDLPAGDRLAGELAVGTAVPFGEIELPRGRYDSLRVGYLVADPAPTAFRRWLPQETLVLRRFCIGSARDHIRLEIAAEDHTTRVRVGAPPCGG